MALLLPLSSLFASARLDSNTTGGGGNGSGSEGYNRLRGGHKHLLFTVGSNESQSQNESCSGGSGTGGRKKGAFSSLMGSGSTGGESGVFSHFRKQNAGMMESVSSEGGRGEDVELVSGVKVVREVEVTRESV